MSFIVAFVGWESERKEEKRFAKFLRWENRV
jgi:hypothetical protein